MRILGWAVGDQGVILRRGLATNGADDEDSYSVEHYLR